jgi:hypothetical protein
MEANKKLPITRNPLFFDANLFSMFEAIGLDYLDSWVGQKVILYQVDRIKTNVDDLYGETEPDTIKYSTPTALPCRYEIKQTTNESYLRDNKSARYKQSGNIEVYLYDKTLKDYGVDVKYGDLLGVAIDEDTIHYFEISDDGKRNFANTETMFGYKRLWRKIVGVEIDTNVFQG